MESKVIEQNLKDIVLSNGLNAADYVKVLPEEHQDVATQAILNVMAKGWPLNDMEITSEGRDLRRKALTAEHGFKNKRALIEKLGQPLVVRAKMPLFALPKLT